MNRRQLIQTLATATSVELAYDEKLGRDVVSVRFDNKEAAIATYLAISDLTDDPEEADQTEAVA